MQHRLEQNSIGVRVVHRDTALPLIRLERNDWESDFFGRKQGRLVLEADLLATAGDEELAPPLALLVQEMDQREYDLVELRLYARQTHRVPVLEDFGFRLVDSRFSFLTTMGQGTFEVFELRRGTIRWARADDIPAMQRLNQICFVQNPHFISRFKNRRFFTADDTLRYYDAWIENQLGREGALFTVIEDQGKVVAYHSWLAGAPRDGLPLYKGALVACAPEYRGQKALLAMKCFMYQTREEERWIVDNTTQLSNYTVIKNHIRSQKQLHAIELIFYRHRPAA